MAIMKMAFWVVMLSFFLTSLPVEAREIVDMSGRKVAVPDRIQKVYSTSPPATYMLYALDPSLLGGLNTPLKETEKRYLAPEIHSLPVLGGYFGQGQVANTEMILKAKPDVVIMWASHESALNRKMEADMRMLGIPLVLMRIDRVEDYGRGLRFLGTLLNREERAEKLARYGEEAVNKADAIVKSIPAANRPSVYYAEGIDGLFTECDTSPHAELINLTGAKNVHRCQTKTGYGMEKVSMEQVILYNPDVIIVQEKEALRRINADKRWLHVKAVKQGKVFIVPKIPFNWFDRPPSYMRYLGIQWLMKSLYPGDYRVDLVAQTRSFYRLFFRMELSDEQIREILAG
ncbi:MAG: ABC transporter substrate-binding protein [Syntrophaceae bacterium]|nr:ABC transporter substrate-binding protein [Syntrophaceae bacterium]